MQIRFTKNSESYACFNNSFPTLVTVDNISYPDSESAFQAQKTEEINEKIKMSELSGEAARKAGRNLELRQDWDDVKYTMLVDVLFAKFTQNLEIQKILLDTGTDELIADMTSSHGKEYGKCYCNKCNGQGRNLLGKALMEVRRRISINQMMQNI